MDQQPPQEKATTPRSMTSLNQKLWLAKTAAFVMTPETQDMLYDKFHKSYMDAVGSAWSKDKFLQRASRWNFFGPDDMSGFVATRPQQGGLEKLVGAAGNPKGVIKGIQELQQNPTRQIWGAISEDLVRPATKHGLIAPHLLPYGPEMIKKFLPNIPSRAFGGVTPEITDRGSLMMKYPDVGEVEKFFVGSPSYFQNTVKRFMPGVSDDILQHINPNMATQLSKLAPEMATSQGLKQVATRFLPDILKHIRL